MNNKKCYYFSSTRCRVSVNDEKTTFLETAQTPKEKATTFFFSHLIILYFFLFLKVSLLPFFFLYVIYFRFVSTFFYKSET